MTTERNDKRDAAELELASSRCRAANAAKVIPPVL